MSYRRLILVAAAATFALANLQAYAQTKTPQAASAQARMGGQAEPACEKEVKDYLNALHFVKQASGNGIASRIEKVFVDESAVVQVSEKQGYCSAAQMLKSKGASR
jgi:hypothetical protein